MERGRKKNEDVAAKLASSEAEKAHSTSTGTIQQHIRGGKS